MSRTGKSRHPHKAAQPSGPTRVPATASRWPLILSVLPVLPFVLAGIYNLVAALGVVVFPADVNFGEGVLLCEAQRLARGLPLYKAVNTPPYWVGTYPPFYQAVAALGGAHGFTWPRIISLVSSLWCGSALAMMVYRASRRWVPALLAAALWFSSPFIGNWLALARVDMLGRALETSAVFCVWFWPKRRWSFLAAVIFSTLAMLTKQTLIAGGLVCAGILWLLPTDEESDPRHVGRWWPVAFLIAWGLLTTLCYAALNLATHGYFLRNLFGDAVRSYQPAILFSWLGGLAESHWGPIVVLVAAGVHHAMRKTRTGNMVPASPGTRVFFLAALAGIPSMILAGNDGADVNYFFDFVWGMCGLVALAGTCEGEQDRPHIADSGNMEVTKQPRPWLLIAGQVLLGVFGLQLLLMNPIQIPTREQVRTAREILNRLAAVRKPVLAELPGFALLNGSDLDYLPYMYKQLEDAGRWNSKPVADDIRRHKYGAILVSSMAPSRWGPSILEAIYESYSPAREYQGGYIIDGEITLILLLPK